MVPQRERGLQIWTPRGSQRVQDGLINRYRTERLGTQSSVQQVSRAGQLQDWLQQTFCSCGRGILHKSTCSMPLMTLKCSTSQQTAMQVPMLRPRETASMSAVLGHLGPCFLVKRRWVHALQVREHRSCNPLAQTYHARFMARPNGCKARNGNRIPAAYTGAALHLGFVPFA